MESQAFGKLTKINVGRIFIMRKSCSLGCIDSHVTSGVEVVAFQSLRIGETSWGICAVPQPEAPVRFQVTPSSQCDVMR